MRAVSVEIREKIIKCYEDEILTIEEITELFNVSERSVYRYLSLNKQQLSLMPKSQPGRPSILTGENLQLIKDIVLSKNDSTLQEYADIFEKKTGIKVSFVTIYNACQKLDIRFKKKFLRSRKRSANS